MSDTHPGVEDEIEHALRLGLATAAQMADRIARARHDLARDALHRSEQEARTLEARFRAEGASATARLAVIDRPEWWDRATPADVVAMYELAAAWQDDQPRAAVAAERIAQEVQDQYGIDLNAPSADSDAVRSAMAGIELERAAGRQNPEHGDDAATAIAAVVRADQRDAVLAASIDHGPGYDSAERRDDTATRMRAVGVPAETVAVAMRADVAYARPAAEAATGTSRTAGARLAQGRGTAHALQRLDRAR